MKGWETLDGGVWEVWQKAHFIPPHLISSTVICHPQAEVTVKGVCVDEEGAMELKKWPWGWNDGRGQKRQKEKKIGVLEAWAKLAFLSNLISQMAIAHLPDRDYETFLMVILAGNFESMIRPNLLMPSLSRSLQLWLPHVFHSSLMRVCPWTHSQG